MSFRGLDGAVVIDEIGPAGHRMYLESERVLMELCRKVTEDSLALLPKLLSFLKHDDPNIVKQSITTGTSLFCAVLAEIALQLNKSNRLERWLEKMWSWMLQFKDAIFGIFLEPGSVGAKLVAIKFLETCVLCFTSDENAEVPYEEGKDKGFNVSWLLNGHPIFNKASLITEANNALKILLDLVQSAGFLQASLTITAVNCLAAIARNRELHYDAILSSLLGFAQNGEGSFGGHIASVRYSLRTAFVGFLKCNHSSAVESRETLIKCLRSLSPGEAIEQVIRQVEKISRTERMNRDSQVSRDDQPSGQALASGEMARIRSGTLLDDVSSTEEGPLKRMRLNTTFCSIQPGDKSSDFMDTSDPTSASKSNLSPVGKMIAMIGALLAEGERGSESLEILISNIHSDLLADIVLETMKHLPSIPLSSFANNGNMRLSSQISPRGSLSQLGSAFNTNNGTYSLPSNLESTKLISSENSMSTLDVPALSSLLTDFKRDPRRDPRRFDPRLAAASIGQPLASNLEISSESKNEAYHSSGNLILPSEDKVEHPPAFLSSICGGELLDRTVPTSNQLDTNEYVEVKDTVMELEPEIEVLSPSKMPNSAAHAVSEEVMASTPSDATESESIDGNAMESYHCSSPVSTTPSSEDASHDVSKLPLQVELTVEQEKALCKLAIIRIFKDCKQVCDIARNQPWLPLLARVVAQNEADDAMISLLQGHITLDCDRQRGHELAMHLLYYIHALMLSESSEYSTFAASNYERFLLSIAKSFLDSLPASDKSFSRLLGEAPFLPGSVLRLLEDVCCSSAYDHLKKESDGDRVTQGLGAIWSLILYRPSCRQACLDIALKCAVHEKEEVRTKAIRLVVNKLYLLSYSSENIENFARKMLLSLVDDQVLESELKYASSSVQRTASPVVQEMEVGCTSGSSISVSQSVLESDSLKHSPSSLHNAPSISLSQAQQKTSLYFALCSKKPNLFKLVFDIYGRASKAIKQSIHRHVPVMLRNLGPSSNVLQYIISDPPEGCENLISLVLQVITEETTASADLIAAVKHLYGTRMKDAAILIPVLPSLSKDEVLPIFPRLVDLPIEKFQAALACILQGSAHTGPALTPVEVLNAIHDINPDKDGIALKKITEACTACFEQRTVFTQQVLEKSLNCLVDKTPLPLLLMRTVIQTIDAFPSMVDFIMVILSRLVIRQIWRMPKLWVGFLKCASQTMPHSCSVLLELPAPQLEAALNKHPDMRVRLASFANQPSIRNSLSSQTLRILGLIQDEE